MNSFSSSSKKWDVQNNFKFHPFGKSSTPRSLRLEELRTRISNFKLEKLISVLLENRGIKTKREIEEFLYPRLQDVTVSSVGIDRRQLKKAVLRIKKAIEKKEQIVVFGDYDVDGICGTAILWEVLHSLGAKVMPYIPHRIEEGYGLSVKSLNNVINTVMPNSFRHLKSQGKKILKPIQQVQGKQVQDDKGGGLIITVDNGIVANEAVEFANKQGIDVIITDHHVPSKKLPKAYAIVHTTKLCGAGVAYLLSQSVLRVMPNSFRHPKSVGKEILKPIQQVQGKQVQDDKEKEDNHLELVALATIADLVPLLGANRTLTYYGLQKLKNSKRPGLLALFEEAEIDQKEIGVWEVGHVIAPRLNAMGRIEYAMDSLRLLCTKDKTRAKKLADLLGKTNRERQLLTLETTQHASSAVRSRQSAFVPSSGRGEVSSQKSDARKLLFIAHESYQQGVIGLVAGKLVEEFYRPSIVIAKGEKYSKASARSVHGFNIIEFIRSASEFLVDAGGHPMAAGFTVETEKLPLLEKALHDLAHKSIDADKLVRSLRIDCELPLSLIDQELYQEIQKLAPFGMGNPEPTFVYRNVVIEDMRVVGQDGRHIKFILSCHPELVSGSNLRLKGMPKPFGLAQGGQVRHDIGKRFDGIAFGMGERAKEFHVGDKVDLVYTIDEDFWNGNKRLQLKIKDIKHGH